MWVRDGMSKCYRCKGRKIGRPIKRQTKAQRQTSKARKAQLEQRARKATKTTPNRSSLEPVGVVEIAERLDVKVDTVHHWRIRHADTFPASRGTVGGNPWYSWAEVRRWAVAHGRAGT